MDQTISSSKGLLAPGQPVLPLTPGIWQGGHYNSNVQVTGVAQSEKAENNLQTPHTAGGSQWCPSIRERSPDPPHGRWKSVVSLNQRTISRPPTLQVEVSGVPQSDSREQSAGGRRKKQKERQKTDLSRFSSSTYWPQSWAAHVHFQTKSPKVNPIITAATITVKYALPDQT